MKQLRHEVVDLDVGPDRARKPAVLRDWREWSPRVREGGLVAFHGALRAGLDPPPGPGLGCTRS